MTILVTGSSGHLGEAIMRLLRDGHEEHPQLLRKEQQQQTQTQTQLRREVIGIDIKPSPYTDIVGDITDPKFCQQMMAGRRVVGVGSGGGTDDSTTNTTTITAVIHTASLHKPHVVTHTKQEFIDTNITGTLNLLQAAVNVGTVQSFVFTSTTSAFGDALKPTSKDSSSSSTSDDGNNEQSPATAAAAVWIDESVRPIPKNIYGVTKTAAEDMCQLFWKLHKLPCIILKVSRFFYEEDDSKDVRNFCSADNAKVNELLYRRADIYDMATAHLVAMDKAPTIGFDKFVISGTSPFQRTDLRMLLTNPDRVVESYYPNNYKRIYTKLGWKMFPTFDRVYRNDHARNVLGWEPIYTFEYVLKQLDCGQPIGSDLSRLVGSKGYHDDDDDHLVDHLNDGDGGPFPVDSNVT